uniref:Anoctamin n=1 Tax=Ascaris lumbricoides TaxID=6252 RepID=A0A9J2Q3A6_ASCLU
MREVREAEYSIASIVDMSGENSEESDAISLPIDYVLAYKMDDKNGELERRAFEEILLDIDISEKIHANCDTEEIEFKKRGLLYMAMRGVYSDMFILHDPSQDEPYYRKMRERSFWEYCKFVEGLKTDARRTLSKQWIPFYKFQPLDKIRDYFGEKITFYFAWEGTFLTALWPAAVIGIICFTYGLFNSTQQIANLCLKAFDNAMNPVFAIFISIWEVANATSTSGTVFMQVWNRNRSILAYQWSVQDYVESEPDRPEFFGTRKEKVISKTFKHSSMKKKEGNDEWIYPLSRLYLKLILSAIIVLLCMSVAVGSVIAFNLTCTIMVSMLPSLMNTISTMILGTVYGVIANKLTYWENHRTNSEYNNALIVKLFAFQFVNNYTSLFYLAFIRPEYYGLQHNGLFGLGADYKDTCDYGTCGSLLALQVLSHMLIKPVPKFCKDVVFPYFMTSMKTFRWNRRISAINEQRAPKVEEEENSRLLREWMKPDAGDFTLGEFTEKMILLGCIMVSFIYLLIYSFIFIILFMFAPLFPLAPLLALVIGLIDIRIDARRLVWFNRRPIAFIATNIGIWNAIVNFIQYFAVITNTFIGKYLLYCIHVKLLQRINIFIEGKVEEEENSRLLREWMKPDAGDFTLGEFTEKMILLGCIMVSFIYLLIYSFIFIILFMFAPLFPLAPLLALVIGLIDIRIDARRLVWFNRRPIAFIATNIGIWNAIVNFIQYFAVITNTFIGKYLLYFLLFQNTVFASKFLIASLIPEVPSGIRLAQRRKRYVNSKIMETGIVPQINRKK